MCQHRWLSLGRCLNRFIEQWEPLTSFFREEAQNRLDAASNSNLQEYRIPKLNQDTQSKASDVSVGKKRSAACVPSTVKKAKISANNAESTKEILSREERLFMFLSSDVNKAYVSFLLNTLPIFEE